MYKKRRMRRRPLALTAALLLLLSAAGCSPQSKKPTGSSDVISSSPEAEITTAPPKENKEFTLHYNAGDSLNPFSAATRSNLQLATLLFESLTALDDQWTAQPSLAASVTVDSTTVTALLRSDAVFSDGSPVTAADAAASFELAKASDNYKALLQNVASASVSGNSVVFTLNSPDPNAAACLTFPIIKAGSGDAPIGSGRYVFSGGDSPALERNPHNADGGAFAVVRLKDLPNTDAVLRALEGGTISYYFDDLSSGEIPRTSSASASVPLPSLVFIGVNSQKSELSAPEVRCALSKAVAREELAANAFAGRAQASASPFPPAFGPAVECTGIDAAENVAVAVAQLEQAGYNSENGRGLSLELLVSEDNSFRKAAASLLVDQLARAGVSLTVTTLPHSELVSRLQSGDFELYLGEIRLTADMSLRPLLASDGTASYGVDVDGAAAVAYAQYLAGTGTLQQFVDAFAADAPFLPLCWRNGLAAFDRSLIGVESTAFDAFHGFDAWSFS